jgi:hypothetical protein
VRISQLLDLGIELDGGKISVEEAAQRYRALVAEWESTIERIRSLPNFEDFLKPLRASRLKKAAENGPVVVLNVAEKSCDALVLVDGVEEVIHIPLPDITFKRVTVLRDELKNLLFANGIRLRGERAAQKWTDEGDGNDCAHVLAEVWNGLIKPVLESLAFSVR